MKKPGWKQTLLCSYTGYITQAIINNLAPLLFLIFREEFGFTLEKVTLITTINFLVQLNVDALSAKFIDQIGYRVIIVAAHFFCVAGLLGMAVLPSVLPAFAGMMVSVVLYAIGGGLTEVLISPIVEACPTDDKASAMSLLHSFYCWGTVAVVLLSTLFLWAFGKGSWRILCFLWAIVPFVNGFAFIRVPLAKLTEEGEGMTIADLLQSKLFWIFVVLMVASGASEQSMSQWASAFAESGLHVSKTVGDLTGPCFFSILMGLSRVFYAKTSEKVPLLPFIMGSAVLCVGSYLLASLSPSPVISLIGCGLCGLSVGILWPGVFSLASSACPKGGTALFALLALAGDMGCSGGPTLVGMAASAFGDNLKRGLLPAILFPILLLIFGSILKGYLKKHRA